ncbi:MULTISPECIES: inositol monophosphatase family protein [unclassified Lentilitoribacter]|jgi:myo-inositol-1(or 4)-monophosphatase|uniref:inositol monophosphatase family protein n=1 Tax=unclassified Lentilitoribacter TaxID=2647570 RepID=UPI0013A6EDAC|nr:inositol monophosphatase family protein [Lentilitoribacter sp. Alg239-R112]
MARSALLNVMVTAATKAGRSLSRDFGEVQNLQVSVKGQSGFVGEAGKKSEDIVRGELMHARPSYGYLSEDDEVKGTDGTHRWIVDPLDGTTNFLHGIPFFSISIALERGGELVAGVIYNPATDELFTAEKGGGAYMNDRRLRVGGRKKLRDCVVGACAPHLGRGHHGRYLIQLANMMGEVSGVRSFGAASLELAYVASGHLDAHFEEHLKPWDIAAGIVMIREAGGFIYDVSGGYKMFETGDLVAGNEHIQKALTEVIKRPAPNKAV